jgi:hypothetical protein
MPSVFDNIDLLLHPALQRTRKVAYRADFCVGYYCCHTYWMGREAEDGEE